MVTLTNLRELDLDNNLISEIKGLENLTNLQELRLFGNEISEIQGVNRSINLQIVIPAP